MCLWERLRGKVRKVSGSGDIGDAKEPLLHGAHKNSQNYSFLLAILTFLFPALEGLVYGYDIGATACARISLESATLSGVSYLIGLLVFGTGIGLAMHAAPMYMAETAPSQIRGQLLSLEELFIVIGMVVLLCSWYLADVFGGWRYMYGPSIPLVVIMGIGMWWLPESPRWILLPYGEKETGMI
ncbi:putative major facilitator, sugar transporter, major facilitator superfamily [Rosa chinensis]|uniref:Putative major facilitator, sugar transporter, major facilitator superfamily n=1 Tax=Rosa chinensis TaxID=74649 RepID=A0A2P6PPP4_ROSCH|nr:putative major facilitator, sugar transporter, major facilitator superfamily [Rosa chinensis]